MGDISTLTAIKYTDKMVALLQERRAKFSMAVTTGEYAGAEKAQVVDQIGAVEMEEKLSRYPEMPPDDAPYDSRWITGQVWWRSIWKDTLEELTMLVDTKPASIEALVSGMNRKINKTIATAFFADAITGKNGTSTTAFDTTNQRVAVDEGASAATNLTVAKLLKGLEILTTNEIDMDVEQVYVAISAKNKRSLLKEAQVTSGDFNRPERPVLQDGRLSFLNINFIEYQNMPFSSGTIRRVPMWVKSGMHFGTWKGPTTDISQIKTRVSLPWRAYIDAFFGATRLEEKRVVDILCEETA